MLKAIFTRHQQHLKQPWLVRTTLFAFGAFCVALIVNAYAGSYATQHASNPVTDIVLSNTPVFDVDGYFVWGAATLVIFISLLLLVHPKRTPFVLYSLALFFGIRAFFITLTHIGNFPTQTPINFTSNLGIFLSTIFFQGAALFFSAHTGAAFLMALVFWQEKKLRYIFLSWSMFFAAVVLLGHIHYSIDVASAFFITYTIYHIALWLFPRERALFVSQ